MGCFRAGLCQGKPKLRSIGAGRRAPRGWLGGGWGIFVFFFLSFLSAFGLLVYICWIGLGLGGWDPIWRFFFLEQVRLCYGVGLGRAGQPVYEPDRIQPARGGLAFGNFVSIFHSILLGLCKNKQEE